MAAALFLFVMALLFSALLWVLDRLLPTTAVNPMVEAIMLHLPQSQCAQCGYPGCQPYAEAVALGEAINLCPPGGERTVRALSDLLGRPLLPISTANPPTLLAYIRAEECIGCALCLAACPVDAILGANGFLHQIIEEHCTGCALCLPPCPVDCIELIEVSARHD